MHRHNLYLRLLASIACICFISIGPKLQAEVTFEWVTVGDQGNLPDQDYGSGQFGSVEYTYRISKHEVTNSQYVEFLNAVDPVGTNPNGVYHSGMSSDVKGGIAFDAGAADGSMYSTKLHMENKPANYISFFDSMRFVNWLANGQPTDGGGTEAGVYTISDGLSETRAPGAAYFIPSEDEWYKAAYYQPALQGGDIDNYWLYPTASNDVPTIATANAVGDISNPGTNVVNHLSGADWNGIDGNVTTVGSTGLGSASFYGTFDQAGNVWEWNEAVSDSKRLVRGGPYGIAPILLAASERVRTAPKSESGGTGFRVASVVPEPSSLLIFVAVLLGVAASRKRGSTLIC